MPREPSQTHAVIIPSFNSGNQLGPVIREVCTRWAPVWLVLDGSTDESVNDAIALDSEFPHLHVVRRDANGGKGEAFLAAARQALAHGFTHALSMDADGQHCVEDIVRFMSISRSHPDAMILGVPVFGSDAPIERVKGRTIGNWWTRVATCGGDIGDSLFGFRVYPLGETVRILDAIRTARRFDFDTELVVRLYWRGIRPVNVPSRVTYPSTHAGGVSHFRYLRDNVLLIGTHLRLFFGMLGRIPRLLCLPARHRKSAASSSS